MHVVLHVQRKWKYEFFGWFIDIYVYFVTSQKYLELRNTSDKESVWLIFKLGIGY